MPRYQESEVRYCNKARLVILAACISTALLFYGLIEALAPQPKLRIKLDNDAELLALKLDFDGDGKITTSDIIAALSGDEKELEALENEMMGLKLENVVAMRKKELQIREKKFTGQRSSTSLCRTGRGGSWGCGRTFGRRKEVRR